MPGAVLRLLGRPPGWGGQDELLATLHDLYQVASASVRDVALADLEDEQDAGAEEEPMSAQAMSEQPDGPVNLPR